MPHQPSAWDEAVLGMQGDGARRAGWEALLTMAASAEGSSFLFTGHSISLAHLRLSLMDRRAREVLTTLALPRTGAAFGAQAPLRMGVSMCRTEHAAGCHTAQTVAKASARRSYARPAVTRRPLPRARGSRRARCARRAREFRPSDYELLSALDEAEPGAPRHGLPEAALASLPSHIHPAPPPPAAPAPPAAAPAGALAPRPAAPRGDPARRRRAASRAGLTCAPARVRSCRRVRAQRGMARSLQSRSVRSGSMGAEELMEGRACWEQGPAHRHARSRSPPHAPAQSRPQARPRPRAGSPRAAARRCPASHAGAWRRQPPRPGRRCGGIGARTAAAPCAACAWRTTRRAIR